MQDLDVYKKVIINTTKRFTQDELHLSQAKWMDSKRAGLDSKVVENGGCFTTIFAVNESEADRPLRNGQKEIKA